MLAPSAPVEQFSSVIVEAARDAYLNSGFVAPRVSMRFDEAKNPVALVVEEGKRYRRGKVRFVGATKIPVDVVVTDLTTPPAPPATRTPFKIDLNVAAATARIDGCDTDPPAESTRPFWSRELWASFHPNWRAVAEDRVRRALASRGFFQAKFTIEITPGPADEADLLVRVTEEGRPARLSGIDLSGLTRNTREAVIAVMGLKENGPIDLNAMLVAQQALWDTGRFKKHAMRLQQDNEGIELGNARLKLDLDEHPTLPLLGEELSPAQQAMLRFGAWMERFDERGDELAAVASGTGLRMEIVLSARGNWLVHAHEPVAAATRPANAESTRGPSTASSRRSAVLDYAFAATDDRVTLFDPAHARLRRAGRLCAAGDAARVDPRRTHVRPAGGAVANVQCRRRRHREREGGPFRAGPAVAPFRARARDAARRHGRGKCRAADIKPDDNGHTGGNDNAEVVRDPPGSPPDAREWRARRPAGGLRHAPHRRGHRRRSWVSRSDQQGVTADVTVRARRQAGADARASRRPRDRCGPRRRRRFTAADDRDDGGSCGVDSGFR